MYNPCVGFITDRSIGQNKCAMSFLVFRRNQTYKKRDKIDQL